MKVAYKIWLDSNGKAFGKGPNELLKRVGETSSLSRAAAQMGMSYSKAWRLIRCAEKNLGFLLLERTVGGLAGGGSKVTEKAKEWTRRYDNFEKDLEGAIEQIYRDHFGNVK